MSSSEARSPSAGGRAWLLAVGVCLLVWILARSDLRAVLHELGKVRFAALAVVAAHLPVIAAAGFGWRCLLPAGRRPTIAESLRLRLIKEAINALLPVAQVGGDVVRARLATNRRLPLNMAAGSCIVDVAISLVCLAAFICLGLAAASAFVADPRIAGFAIRLSLAVAALVSALIVAERLGVVQLLDRAAAQSAGALGKLAGVGEQVRALSRRRPAMADSALWHLASWGFGVFETWTALWVVGAHTALGAPSLGEAFVLESLIQGARAAGFAIPGALGVQEGGYLLVCSALGVPASEAVALSLLRRMRELSLGVAGLALWRFHPGAVQTQQGEELA